MPMIPPICPAFIFWFSLLTVTSLAAIPWSATVHSHRSCTRPKLAAHALALIGEVNLLGLPPWSWPSRNSAPAPGRRWLRPPPSRAEQENQPVATTFDYQMFTVEGSAADLGVATSAAVRPGHPGEAGPAPVTAIWEQPAK